MSILGYYIYYWLGLFDFIFLGVYRFYDLIFLMVEPMVPPIAPKIAYRIMAIIAWVKVVTCQSSFAMVPNPMRYSIKIIVPPITPPMIPTSAPLSAPLV